MQQSTAIVEDSRVLDRAVAVVRGLGTMSSPELIEMLYSISSDIAESFERLAEDVPLLFLRTVVLGTTAPAGPDQPRGHRPFTDRMRLAGD